MILSSNECNGWPAKHLLPVDGDEGQIRRKSVSEEGCIVRDVEFLGVKVLIHATYILNYVNE